MFATADAADRAHDNGLGIIIYRDNAHLHGVLAMTMAANVPLLVSNSDGTNPDASFEGQVTLRKEGTV